MTPTTKTNAYLLVEGTVDRDVCSELRDIHGISRDGFTIQVAGSKSEIGQQFIEHLLADDRRAIGLVMDADANISSSWQSIQDRIQRTRLNYSLPPNPDGSGLIIQPPDPYSPRIGVWLMPNNQTSGELEDFVCACIVESDPLLVYAEQILNDIEAAQLHRYRNKRSKAFLYTWLAWQQEPGSSMRTNFKKDVLSAYSPIALTFADWLNPLFNS
jgi:hypothetical protein